MVVILAMPVVGIVAYLLLGEVNIGRRRVARMREVLASMPDVTDAPGSDAENLRPEIPRRYEHLFRVASSINGFKKLLS